MGSFLPVHAKVGYRRAAVTHRACFHPSSLYDDRRPAAKPDAPPPSMRTANRTIPYLRTGIGGSVGDARGR